MNYNWVDSSYCNENFIIPTLLPLKYEQRKLPENAKKIIPYTQFDVSVVQKEYDRLIKLGVEFSVKPTEMGALKLAVFNDTCGNHIQIVEIL